MDQISATAQETHVDVEAVMRQLDEAGEKLPVEQLRLIQRHRDLFISPLIESIRQATTSLASDGSYDGNAAYFAYFLLTEFKAKPALPAIIDSVSLPDELPFELYGDAITEHLSSVFAALANESLEIIDQLIMNREVNEYVRWGGAQTYRYLVRDGVLTREQAVEKLRAHLRDALQNNDSIITEFLLSELYQFTPHEAWDEIQQAFRQVKIDPFMLRLEDIKKAIDEGDTFFEKSLRQCRPTGFSDAVVELERWYALSDRPIPKTDFDSYQVDDDDYDDDELIDSHLFDDPATIRNTSQRVGRNEPCPCGSGKKYKKCCGRN
ncbi:MAG: DUF1186 domain-containing protein [Planctomycetota bacterium]|nr:DUF1186 domain-containing protein [Planctomycetota bacterium]MDA1213637.1 DUF1186 domain-containing protein [Planctomycetota bacterium]